MEIILWMQKMETILWHHIISKRWNTVGDHRYDLEKLLHCVTLSEKQEINDVIQKGLFPWK